MFHKATYAHDAPKSRVAVTLVMQDGEKMSGHVNITTTAQLADAFNKEGHFVEFETAEGDLLLLNKRDIKAVLPVVVPRTNQLKPVNNDLGAFDPYKVLGVDVNASQNAIRVAYHALARNYHPDRFSSVELPKEMQAYVNAMSTRINMAYQQLEASNQNQKAAH